MLRLVWEGDGVMMFPGAGLCTPVPPLDATEQMATEADLVKEYGAVLE